MRRWGSSSPLHTTRYHRNNEQPLTGQHVISCMKFIETYSCRRRRRGEAYQNEWLRICRDDIRIAIDFLRQSTSRRVFGN